MRRLGSLVALAVSAGLLMLGGSAGAATTTGYADFSAFAGAAGAFTSTATLPGLGWPSAALATTSNSGSGVGVQSGASTFLPASSPPGGRFGSSLNQQYVNIAQAPGATASVSTYTFASAVPVGWGFVLGDVDADQVQVSATKADGSPASAADLGFAGTFNYAGGANVDQPTWNASTLTLVGSGANTNGAAGWFTPTVPLRTLSFRFSQVVPGVPTFQTWFGVVDRAVSGTVSTSGGCDVTATTVRLLDGAGGVLASVQPATDGSYAFPRVAATDAFTVDVTGVPSGCQVVGPASRAVDLRTADAVADFALGATPAPPAPAPAPTGTASGTVTDRSGDPVADAVVVVRDAAGTEVARDTSGPAGRFAVPGLPVGALTATVRPPSGYVVVGAATQPLVVPAAGGQVTLDFTLRPRSASTSGTVTTAATTTSTAPLPEVGGVPAPLPWLGVLLLVLGGGLVAVPRRRH